LLTVVFIFGLHYPIDIITGYAGAIAGFFSFKIYVQLQQKYFPIVETNILAKNFPILQ
jgi:membrane-associated phospholipid phosphatase